MSERASVTLPIEIQEAQQEFENWRGSRSGRERIPESLWSKAVELGQRHGVWRTAQALRLDFVRLKRRAGLDGGKSSSFGTGFVEWIPQGVERVECVVEMENARGGRMRIELRGAAADMTALTRAFWGVRA